ncbi:formate dehydrogenase delta subunit [Trinickia symbiotica]|uniref:Formate dehydrogenase n=1 Tax=Trinickia symbiotica TaxID=863227 RepID=A0A2N7X1I4_9BURK|nr:formate dehydrogenase subunit delta [Trinickia symbiotica]PMS35623.1 formate dehydrogenase [Trinickia symbiotica]PPK47691.1 formate dehydrogenase delta subunit [Trinickia symbiotica]
MNQHHLVDMANSIGEFFQSMPDHNEALAGIADHIHKFWEPRMRRTILAMLDDPAASAPLLPIVKEALVKARGELTPREAA